MKTVIGFFQDVYAELKKVSWPSRAETIKMTTLVIIATVVVGAYVGVIDFGLTKVIETFIQ
ncbi:preprotein translocase subunit SecE [candidate division WWE3 bacterium]|nr:preprotein translocase subunit SecE [candidate division WWE3 bacterium]